ncbi:MAG: PIN domain-containing protein, partial [Planctomycetes bacterium]|nr:PIN domain-containing protein [Planctomycetota bacterium]
MILVDTSVWIEVFRRQRPLDLEAIVDFGEVVTCPPVVQEVLQGIRDEPSFRLARQAMLALPVVESPTPIGVWLEAAQIYRTVRAAGATVRSATATTPGSRAWCRCGSGNPDAVTNCTTA